VNQAYDAVIIGSGAGGSSLAYRLATAGRRVLVVERGGAIPQADPAKPVGHYLYHLLKQPADPVAFVGGATKFYGASLYRMRESDFGEVRHEAGVSPAWPISYAELEPYYVEAERLYRVHGAPDGDPSEPARSAPYPFPPLPHDPVVAEVVRRLKDSGTEVAAIPRGLDYGPGGACVLCGTCDAYFCPYDAKMDAETAALRPALKTGNVDLVTGVDCLKVLTSDDGARATGVLLSENGVERTVHADIVAVSCGIPGSALLLRRSRTDQHPEGLGADHGLLGRYLGGHSSGVIFPFLGLKSIWGRHTKTFAINSFHDGSPGWPWPSGVIQVAGQVPFWDGASRLMRPLVKFIAQRSLTIFYMTEALPTKESGLVFEGDGLKTRVLPLHNARTFDHLRGLAMKAFRKAGYLVLPRKRNDLWHEVGTARFGHDPKTSVTDVDCQVHGISGLYVVDASVLPTAGSVNTGLTIIALALRTGDAILRRLAGQSAGAEPSHEVKAGDL
jgi:choline dehydrogenase-like flavoprotein